MVGRQADQRSNPHVGCGRPRCPGSRFRDEGHLELLAMEPLRQLALERHIFRSASSITTRFRSCRWARGAVGSPSIETSVSCQAGVESWSRRCWDLSSSAVRETRWRSSIRWRRRTRHNVSSGFTYGEVIRKRRSRKCSRIRNGKSARHLRFEASRTIEDA